MHLWICPFESRDSPWPNVGWKKTGIAIQNFLEGLWGEEVQAKQAGEGEDAAGPEPCTWSPRAHLHGQTLPFPKSGHLSGQPTSFF